MTSNEEIFDKATLHQANLLRYGKSLTGDIIPILEETEEPLHDVILIWTSKAARSLTGADGREWQTGFNEAITKVRQPAWEGISDHIKDCADELISNEALVAAAIVIAALPVQIELRQPTGLATIVNSQPFEGKTVRQWVARTAAADIDRLLAESKIGVSQGTDPSKIARDVSTITANKAKKNIESVIFTMISGMQTEARQSLYAANKHIFDRELFTALLANWTGGIYSKPVGKVFPIGLGAMPPTHFRDKAYRVPVINPAKVRDALLKPEVKRSLLIEFATLAGIAAVTNEDSLTNAQQSRFVHFEERRIRELIGGTPDNLSFNKWIKMQTVEHQNDIVGERSGIKIRKGEETPTVFVIKTPVTINQLKKD